MLIKWYVWVLAIPAFLLTLYLVELGPWSARAVEPYNDGYGTFDMKKYDVKEVTHVLTTMAPDGFSQSYRYYVSDTIFLVFFGLLQVLLSLTVYHTKNTPTWYVLLGLLAIAVPILRGVLDLIENGLLVYVLHSYPVINARLITVASFATKCKLMCIKIWMALMGFGIVYNLIRHYH